MGREQPHPLDLVIDGALPQVRYERELTVGSVGTLWLGRLTTGSEAGRTVLLRRMSLDLFDPKDVESMKQVAQAYSKVRHPSLVKLLGVIEQDRDLVSVSEHLDGVRLNDLLRHAFDSGAPLPATVAVRIVLDAARATVKAHRLAGELGLYPAERLFVAEGVFVAAFGGTLLTEIGMLAAIARCNQPRKIPDLLVQLSPEELERTPTTKGSPEVFSLGVVLWEALANRCLFSRESLRKAGDDLRGLPVAPLNEIERCGMPVPDALAEVVRTATSRNPDERYLTLEQFVHALEHLPAHFVATEHHVANALRNQAAHLLQAFHVDPSQSSLTLAFSEVPASRLSTCPPPEGGFNPEPPTFNQSSLVSGRLKTLDLPKDDICGESASEPTTTGPSSAIPEPVAHEPSRKRWVWLGVGLAAAAAALSVAYFAQRRTATPILPEARSISVTSAAAPNIPDSPPSNQEPTAPPTATDSIAAPQSPPLPQAAENQAAKSKASSSPVTSASAVPENVTSAPTNKHSGAAYRPRQIAPYRPKGI